MKVLQWIAAVAFVVAGTALLCAPARERAKPASGSVSTRSIHFS